MCHCLYYVCHSHLLPSPRFIIYWRKQGGTIVGGGYVYGLSVHFPLAYRGVGRPKTRISAGRSYVRWEMLDIMTATSPAVSVRKRLSPKETGMYPASMALCTSSMLKSPSGPIRMVISDVAPCSGEDSLRRVKRSDRGTSS